jgi:hypothetical protein
MRAKKILEILKALMQKLTIYSRMKYQIFRVKNLSKLYKTMWLELIKH